LSKGLFSEIISCGNQNGAVFDSGYGPSQCSLNDGQTGRIADQHICGGKRQLSIVPKLKCQSAATRLPAVLQASPCQDASHNQGARAICSATSGAFGCTGYQMPPFGSRDRIKADLVASLE
jgi:hypothetical protein